MILVSCRRGGALLRYVEISVDDGLGLMVMVITGYREDVCRVLAVV